MTKARTNADNASADIQGVTAGTGLSGGGTSGTVTLTNDMATTIAAKGDLVVGTGNDTYAALTAGSNGDTLVADSSTSTGLRWQTNFAAGKNRIINGDFNIWQRGTSFNTANAYTADRFIAAGTDATLGTYTVTRETFTPGTAPVAGYEGQFFWRYNRTVAGSGGSYYSMISQRIENVRTFAGQTVTFSFWAKGTATATLTAGAFQDFGSGGSSGNNKTLGTFTVTANWTRYTFTATIDSVSGKTIGTNNCISFYIDKAVTATGQVDIWGYQVEAGNTATAFQTATGTLAGELAACQRYYYRHTAGASFANFGQGNARTTTNTAAFIPFPVPMRTAPTSLDSGTASNYRVFDGQTATTCTTLAIEGQSDAYVGIVYTTVASGLTATRNYSLDANNTTAAYIGFSAEL